MKITGIVCTPRTGGNSEILVKEALTGAKKGGSDTELILIRDKEINPCDGCLKCIESGECHFKDDMEEIGRKIVEADGMIIGVPVYFTTCGIGTNFLDRLVPYASNGHLSNKLGLGLTVGARVAADTAGGVLRRFFIYCHMICVECVAHYGTAPGDMLKNEYAMKSAYELGRLMPLYINNGYKYPDEYKGPISGYIKRKYGITPFS